MKKIPKQPPSPVEQTPQIIPVQPSTFRLNGGVQARTGRDETVVADYTERWKAGHKFPAVKAVYDGTDYWPYDGEHRIVSAIAADIDTIAAEIIRGTQRDAVFLGLSANQEHGLRRTNADKRNAVGKMLADEEWAKWSNVAIAEHIGVSESLVRTLREEADQVRFKRTSDSSLGQNKTRTGKDGKSYPVPAAKPPAPPVRWTPTPPEDEPLDGDQRRIKRLVSEKFFAFLLTSEGGVTALDWQDIAAKTDDQIRAIEKLMSGGQDLAAALEQITKGTAVRAAKAAPARAAAPPPPTKPAPVQADAVETARKRLGSVLGLEFELALLDGRIKLAAGDVAAYAGLDDAKLKEAASAIQEGFAFARYERAVLGKIDPESRVSDLMHKCIACGGRFEINLGAYHFAVTRPAKN